MENKKMPTWKLVVFIIVLVIPVAILTKAIENDEHSVKTSHKDNQASTIDSSLIVTDVDTTVMPYVNEWIYTQKENKMTSDTTYIAKVDATEQLQFRSPYDGGATATLVIRNRSGNNSVYVVIDKGQMLTRSYEDTSYQVRFDTNKAVRYNFTAPSDGSSNISFISDNDDFIKKAKKSKSVIIELEFYQEGLYQIEFNISDLKWNH